MKQADSTEFESASRVPRDYKLRECWAWTNGRNDAAGCLAVQAGTGLVCGEGVWKADIAASGTDTDTSQPRT